MEMNEKFLGMETYRTMLDIVNEGIYFVDNERRITFWNKGAERITGFEAKDIIGKFCYDNILNHIDEFGNKICLNGCPLHTCIIGEKAEPLELYLHHKDGHRKKVLIKAMPIFNDGEIVGCIETFVESSGKKTDLHDVISKDEVENLRYLALYDQLTELPNRRNLEANLKKLYQDYKDFNIPFGVIFMDIDHFRDFNNNYGHDVGDMVLKVVAKSLKDDLRPNDIVGRWGGEEFIGFFPNVTPLALGGIIERLRVLVENSVIRDKERDYCVPLSLGGTIVREDDDMESVVKRADKLMYDSKQNGRNRSTIG